MDFTIVFLLQVVYGVANLALIGLGLAIVFGMMRVINLAHGEFLMLGGYTVVSATNAGIDIWISMFVLAPVVVGAIGVLVERLLIRHLYGRTVDTLLATWGLSLLIVGIVTAVFGPQTSTSISPPIGAVEIGNYGTSGYEIFLIVVTAALFALIYLLFRYTKLGLIARGTMQRADVAASLGISTDAIYMMTFGLGSAVAGLAGGLLAPITGVVPTIGATYIAKAFITVISGGSAILAGTASAAALLGAINNLSTFALGPTLGEVALLAAAIVLLRLMPNGITGRYFRGSL